MPTSRREFVTTMLSAAASGAAHDTGGDRTRLDARHVTPPDSAKAWRAHFPILAPGSSGHGSVYLDTAATSHRPHAVIDAIAEFYRHDNGNPGAQLHAAARGAHKRYEDARATTARFIGATDPMEIVFTRGTTEAINLVAAAWGGGEGHLGPGDDIVVGSAEHASNMVPWQMIAKRTGATVRWFGITDDGQPRLDELRRVVGPRTRMVSFSHVSNVLGQVNPVREMCDIAHAGSDNVIVLVDGAQSVPHVPVDVHALGCDFLAFSGHKMMGPMGSGVLWGRRTLLDAMAPYHGGGNMAHAVDLEGLELSHGALKFGAGTPNVAGAVGLAAAADFIGGLGWESIVAHERALCVHALSALREVPGLRVLGSAAPADRIAVFAFTLQNVPVPEIVRGLDARGVMVRGGDLASLPLLKRLGTNAAARASCYLYTSTDDIDRLTSALRELARGGR